MKSRKQTAAAAKQIAAEIAAMRIERNRRAQALDLADLEILAKENQLANLWATMFVVVASRTPHSLSGDLVIVSGIARGPNSNDRGLILSWHDHRTASICYELQNGSWVTLRLLLGEEIMFEVMDGPEGEATIFLVRAFGSRDEAEAWATAQRAEMSERGSNS
jgi:hypothetical protein